MAEGGLPTCKVCGDGLTVKVCQRKNDGGPFAAFGCATNCKDPATNDFVKHPRVNADHWNWAGANNSIVKGRADMTDECFVNFCDEIATNLAENRFKGPPVGPSTHDPVSGQKRKLPPTIASPYPPPAIPTGGFISALEFLRSLRAQIDGQIAILEKTA